MSDYINKLSVIVVFSVVGLPTLTRIFSKTTEPNKKKLGSIEKIIP